MYLDYAKIKSGQRKQPMLRLRTMAGKELGPIPYVHGLQFEINYTSLSTVTFTVPYQVNGLLNPLYTAISSFKEIYTDNFGVYVLAAPSKEGNGTSETKTVTGYSLEYLFEKKNLFLEEGTYNFWNPIDPSDTILGRIVELDTSWHISYVAPRLIGCYRTFDKYDSDALSFCYSDVMEKYNCAVVFDVYEKSINVYDANEDTETLPIYLNYKNLIDTIGVEEIIDEMATKLHLYGSDSLTIRDVNPIGTDYIVDLSYFISKGDLDVKVEDSELTLADLVRNWQSEIAEIQPYYMGLVSSRASLTARKLSAEAKLTELNGEMDSLVTQQSVIIQAFSLEMTEVGKRNRQADLDEINTKIDSKQFEIDAQQEIIDSLQGEINEYVDSIKQITNRLSISAYFTEAEQKVLNLYMIEGTVEEETFIATDVETEVSGTVQKITGTVSVSESNITWVELPEFQKNIYMVLGGTIIIPDSGITAEIVRCTLDAKNDGSYVLTASLGSTDYNGHTFGSGLLTLNGMLSQFSSDISAKTEDEVTEYKGTRLGFNTIDSDSYFTVNTTEFQRYSVAMELYDFGVDVLNDYAWPVYEFSVDSANFLYHKKFEPFKSKLELGKAVYLELGSEGLVKPKIIGVELNFDNISNFKLIFSNRYQLKNGENLWWDIIRSTTRSSRSFDAGKYIYNRSADKATQVDKFMSDLSKGAVDVVLSSSNQSVVANSTGIHIGGDSKYQMRIVDNMIAMTDDGWKTAKLAIGRFASAETGEQWGVNAELIAGKLIIGNNMVLQNPLVDEHGNVTGTMMFQVDATGAWLYNSRIILQSNEVARSNDGGLMILDPRYGIVAGTKLLFDTNGTTVTPEFMDEAGDVDFDSDGMPKNANFFLDIRDGSAYYRGKLIAQSGKIGGYTIEDGYLHSGENKSYVALNGGLDVYPAYAIWAGYQNPDSTLCPFWVKKDGTMKAKDGSFEGGTFKDITANGGNFNDITASRGNFQSITVDGASTFNGTLNAPKLTGALTAPNGDGWIEGCGIKVGKNSSATNGYNFYVDASGNVTMNGSIRMAGNITWDTGDSPCQVLYASAAYSTPSGAYSSYPSSNYYGWHKTYNSSSDYYASYTYNGGSSWTSAIKIRGQDGAKGEKGESGSNASVTRDNIVAALLNATAQDGIYNYDGNIGIRASAIKAGRIDASTVILGTSSGGFKEGYGRSDGYTTYGTMMYAGSEYGTPSYYVMVTNGGVRLQASRENFFVTPGNIGSSIAITQGSDRRIKNSISYEMDKYENFFRKLKPSFYRMNDGTSNRFHLGFIAQDVEESLNSSGLTNSDFAGVVRADKSGKMSGTLDDKYSLRYTEFISLNTYMIQKLDRKFEDLEARIAMIEGERYG